MATNVNKNTNKANSLSPQDVQTVLAALMKLASDRPALESRPEPVILPAVAEGLASIRRQCLRDWLGGPQAPAYLNEGCATDSSTRPNATSNSSSRSVAST